MKPARLAKDYNSDSAESLTEIPVSFTQAGNMKSSVSVLYSQDVTHGGFTRSTLPAARKVSKKRKHPLRKKPLSPSDSQRFNGSFKHEVNSSGQQGTLSSTSGATDTSIGTLPSTDIIDPGRPLCRHSSRHKDVPPLDLSELSGNSDDEIATHSGKKKRKKPITKI